MSNRIEERSPRPPLPCLTRAQDVATESQHAFGAALKRLQSTAERMARELAKGIRSYERDLLQEGLTELWELDPSRYEVDEDEVLVAAMKNRMRRARRRELRQGFVVD